MKLNSAKLILVGLIFAATTPAFAAPQWVEDACWRGNCWSAATKEGNKQVRFEIESV
jgi:hypothetical protein